MRRFSCIDACTCAMCFEPPIRASIEGPNRGFLARGTVGTAIARLWRRTVHERSFQYLHGVLSGLQRRHGIDVEIHTEPMAQLIGNELGIDSGAPRPARMRAAQDLKRHPFQFDGFQSWSNLPSPCAIPF